jgi:hypothetical protein
MGVLRVAARVRQAPARDVLRLTLVNDRVNQPPAKKPSRRAAELMPPLADDGAAVLIE